MEGSPEQRRGLIPPTLVLLLLLSSSLFTIVGITVVHSQGPANNDGVTITRVYLAVFESDGSPYDGYFQTLYISGLSSGSDSITSIDVYLGGVDLGAAPLCCNFGVGEPWLADYTALPFSITAGQTYQVVFLATLSTGENFSASFNATAVTCNSLLACPGSTTISTTSIVVTATIPLTLISGSTNITTLSGDSWSYTNENICGDSSCLLTMLAITPSTDFSAPSGGFTIETKGYETDPCNEAFSAFTPGASQIVISCLDLQLSSAYGEVSGSVNVAVQWLKANPVACEGLATLVELALSGGEPEGASIIDEIPPSVSPEGTLCQATFKINTSQTSGTPFELIVASSPTTTATSAINTTTSSITSSGGGGIPEFPYQILAVTVLIALIVTSYLAVRRRVLRDPIARSRSIG